MVNKSQQQKETAAELKKSALSDIQKGENYAEKGVSHHIIDGVKDI